MLYLTGGQVYARAGGRAEAEMTASVLVEFGIARRRMRLEAASRTTTEDARMISVIVGDESTDRARCYLLITSAFHMPRAVAAFEAVGVPVQPAPTDWRTDDARPILATSFIANLADLDIAVHEYLGLMAQSVAPRRRAHAASVCS